MTQAVIYEGTWEELSTHAEEFRRHSKLTLIVSEPEIKTRAGFRADLSPAERIQLLDSLAERNRSLPPLPPEAFDRENLYADEEELR